MSYQPISRGELIWAMNEWMERFTQNPEEFEHHWKTVLQFLQQQENDEEPSYGRDCVDYIYSLIDE